MAELAYGVQLLPGVLVSPNIQVVLQPDQSSEPARTTDIPNALVFGCKIAISAPALIGR